MLVKTNNTRKALLRDQSFRAVLKTWTPTMIALAEKIAALPPKAGADPMLAWGYVFALDALRHKAPAIRVLLDVVDELSERPQREEVYQIVDRLLAFKVEWKTKLKNHAAPPAPKTTSKVGFTRGK